MDSMGFVKHFFTCIYRRVGLQTTTQINLSKVIVRFFFSILNIHFYCFIVYYLESPLTKKMCGGLGEKWNED